MRKQFVYILSILLMLGGGELKSMYHHSHKTTISVKVINNLIIVPLRVNGSEPLNFILDSGVRNMIISELFADDILNVNNARTITLNGLGSGKQIEAFHCANNYVSSSDLILHNIDIYLIKQDIFHLTQHFGLKINGLIGYDFFRNHVIKINYKNSKIEIYDPETYEHDSEFHLDLVIQQNKPYLQAAVKLEENSPEIESKFLIDTGGSLAIWLSNVNHPEVKVPDKHVYSYLGMGLSGELYGEASRVHSFRLGTDVHKLPVATFPDSNSVSEVYLADGRLGSVCSEILKRYTVTFDYQNLKIGFTKNSTYGSDFKFNHLGIEIYQPIMNLQIYMISYVREGSIAHKMGLKSEDRVVNFDGYSIYTMNLNELYEKIYKIEDEHFSIEVERAGEYHNFSFFVDSVL